MKKIKVFMMAMLVSYGVFAHEGHDTAPGQLKAIHGGTVISGKEFNLEYVISGGEISIYPVSHGAKDLLLKDIKISGTAQTPKGKPTALSFTEKNGADVALLNFGDAYRLILSLSVEYKNKKNAFKIQAEQQ